MVKIGLKNQNYHFKLKYDTSYDLNMPNSMMLFNFFVFGRKYFFGQIWSKNQNYHFKLKFGGWLNSNMQNSMMLSTFLGKFGPNCQYCQFKLKFCRYLFPRLKFQSVKGASLHPAFMGNCPTINHVF